MDFLGRCVLQMGSGHSGGEMKRRVAAANMHFYLNVAIRTNKDMTMGDESDIGSTLTSADMSSDMTRGSMLLSRLVVFMIGIAMGVGIFGECIICTLVFSACISVTYLVLSCFLSEYF